MPPPMRPNKKVKAATVASPDQILARQRGALLGLAVGEALGIRNEQRRLAAIPFPDLNDGPLVEPKGGGRFERPAGQVSWGAEMAQVLSTSLRSRQRFDLIDVGKGYGRWLPHAVDVPDAVKAALGQVAEGRSPEFSGRRVWLEGVQRIADNAPLARTAPIGVFFHSQKEVRISASFEDTAITHFAPLCQLTCATFNGLIAMAIGALNDRLKPDEFIKKAESELTAAASALARKEPDWVSQTKDAAEWIREDLKLAQRPDPELYGPDFHVLFPWPTPIRTSFRLALWEFFHAPTFEAALIDVVNRGGDSDTNAAITGALLGAVWGADAIPRAWIDRVMEAPGQRGGVHWTTYHPRFLVTLTDAPTGEGELEPVTGR